MSNRDAHDSPAKDRLRARHDLPASFILKGEVGGQDADGAAVFDDGS